jgi:DNA-binding transcriptional LysR family regulator
LGWHRRRYSFKQANLPPGRGSLRLNVPCIANAVIIEPMIGHFLATYPDVKLELMSYDGLVDIVADGFDDSIRRDRRLSPGMIALPVGPRDASSCRRSLVLR